MDQSINQSSGQRCYKSPHENENLNPNLQRNSIAIVKRICINITVASYELRIMYLLAYLLLKLRLNNTDYAVATSNIENVARSRELSRACEGAKRLNLLCFTCIV